MYKGVGLFALLYFFKGYVHLSPSSWFKPGNLVRTNTRVFEAVSVLFTS